MKALCLFFWEGNQETFGLETGKLNAFPTIWPAYMHMFLFMFLWKYQSMWMCIDIPELKGFQSYSGHPRTSLFLLFSVSSQSMRGLKYCMSGWAVILGWPVIMAIASGQGLLKPSFITSLQTLTHVRVDGQLRWGSVATACSRDNYTDGMMFSPAAIISPTVMFSMKKNKHII